MKYILVWLFFISAVFGSTIEAPIVNVDGERAIIAIEKINVGMSGFVLHKVGQQHASILRNAVVESFDEQRKEAVILMTPYDSLANNALPKGKWDVAVGDMVLLAFGYTRGLLLAPSENIYYRITRSVAALQWVHPDLFATILSFNGHPTPLQEDFNAFSITTSVGLVYIYLDQRVYTLDAKSLKILATTEAPLEQIDAEIVLPFYTRVQEIDASWWGEGSSRLESYGPYYYELLVKHNPDNRELYEKIKTLDESYQKLLNAFTIGD